MKDAAPPDAAKDDKSTLFMYAFGHVLPSTPLREKLHSVLHHSRFGTWWSALQLLATFYSCTQYVLETYASSFSDARASDLAVSSFFLLDYLMNWYSAPDRRVFPFYFMPMVDLCTILPAFIAFIPGTNDTINFLKVLRVVRSLRILRSFRMIGDHLRPSRKALAELGLMCVCSLFIFSTLFQLVETQFYGALTGKPEGTASDFELDFGDAMYFGVTVLCTVGFGDIWAMTFWGKILTSLLIIFTVLTFMSKLSHFGSALRGPRASPSPPSPSHSHAPLSHPHTTLPPPPSLPPPIPSPRQGRVCLR